MPHGQGAEIGGGGGREGERRGLGLQPCLSWPPGLRGEERGAARGLFISTPDLLTVPVDGATSFPPTLGSSESRAFPVTCRSQTWAPKEMRCRRMRVRFGAGRIQLGLGAAVRSSFNNPEPSWE